MTGRYEMALQAIIEICNEEDPMSKNAAVIASIANIALEKRDTLGRIAEGTRDLR